jgi:hypothetical protein
MNPSDQADDAEQRARAIARELDMSTPTKTYAAQKARLAVLEYPVNRQPHVIAAAAVYYAGLMHDEKHTQAEIVENGEACKAALRDAYREIAAAEGIDVAEYSRGGSEDGEADGATNTATAAAAHRGLHVKLFVTAAVGVIVVALLILTGGAVAEQASEAAVAFDQPPTFSPTILGAAAVVAVLVAMGQGLVQYRRG